jgi:hypothetical protein
VTLPGPDVQIVDAAPPSTSLTDTGTAFVVGLAERGATPTQLAPTDAVTSLGEWITQYRQRQSNNGPDYDTVEAFFAEGGARLYFSRKLGPDAAPAEAAVPAASSKFTATAKGAGAYGNNLTVAVASGVITVKESGTTVEVSPALASTAAAQDWATNSSDWIDITPLASGALSDSAAVALAGGDDDRANITDTEIQTALDRFGKNLGPGQVLAPGDTRTAMHTKLAQHALDRNRFAYGDAPDSVSASTAAAAGTAVRALGRDLARHIQLLDGWGFAPGTAGGTTRTIPPSGVQAGVAARSDSAGNPNRAIAGRNGISRFLTGLKHNRTDADRETLANAGVTAFVVDQGVVQAYDDITPVNPETDPEWLGAAGNRLVMRIVADALEIAKAHMFGAVSGPVDLDAFAGDLKGMLAGWFTERALFSVDGTPAGAYRVETGPSVNTTESLQARQLKAALALKISPNARQVIVQITNTPLTEAL